MRAPAPLVMRVGVEMDILAPDAGILARTAGGQHTTPAASWSRKGSPAEVQSGAYTDHTPASKAAPQLTQRGA